MTQKIKLSDIFIPPRQRKKMDPKKLEALTVNIKTVGKLIHPINVRRTEPGTKNAAGELVKQPFTLSTGGRRLAAHYKLGWDEIEARIFDDLTPMEQKVVELYENLDREDLNFLDELEAKAEILKMRTGEGKTQAQVAEELGEDPGNFSKDIKLHEEIKANPKLREAGTKNAARKAAEHHKEIERRIQTVKQVDVADLKSKIFTASASDYVRTLADASVDLLMWDPPWAMDYKSASDVAVKTRGNIVKGKYDDSAEANLDWITDVISHVPRIIKPSGWVCIIFATTGMNWLRAHLMGACRTHQMYTKVVYNEDTGEFERPYKKCVGHAGNNGECEFLDPEILPYIWYRPNSKNIGQWPDRHAKHMYESIMVVPGSDKARLVLKGKPDVLVYDNEYAERLHEMQKPIPLIADLISRFTVPNELVVDLSFGSGSHLAAAASLGRDFRGCDNNPDNLTGALGLVAQYYKKAKPAQKQEELTFSDEEAENIK